MPFLNHPFLPYSFYILSILGRLAVVRRVSLCRIFVEHYESYKPKLTISRQLLDPWLWSPTPTLELGLQVRLGNLYLRSTAWMRARVTRTRAPKRATRDILGPRPPRYAPGEAGRLVSDESREGILFLKKNLCHEAMKESVEKINFSLLQFGTF